MLTGSLARLLGLTAIGGWTLVAASPLYDEAAGQILQKGVGPLEKIAHQISSEVKAPNRVRYVPAQYPAEAGAERAWARVALRTTIDATGSTAEARVIGLRLALGDHTRLKFDSGESLNRFLEERSAPDTAKRVIDAVVGQAASAVAQWRYEPPKYPPFAVDTIFYFTPDLPVRDMPTEREVRPEPPPPRDGELRVADNITPLIKTKDVRPVYPSVAAQARVEGVVILEIRVDESGHVSPDAVRFMRSIPLLDQAARDAVRQWEFQPTLVNGVPTPVIMTVPLIFALE